MALVYLLDASAVYPLVLRLRESILDYASTLAVLDLTVYEVGNVLWKEHRRGRVRDPLAAARLFQELFSSIKTLRPGASIRGILELAVQEGLTFYDAAYLYTARTQGLRLVTEDRQLGRYPESTSIEQLLRELGSRR
ncbi:MAG: type II toxin-antitoxin system VapC family toxin [Desulfurococcales archaeon]|nr:type II toxin-antitoxin system VapC family toxin [Desulfurococcales archaeon]